jgi:hypothetical protein
MRPLTVAALAALVAVAAAAGPAVESRVIELDAFDTIEVRGGARFAGEAAPSGR